MGDRAHLSIGEVLSLLRDEFPDITISKIRFLESQGLLDPERTPSGYRKFYDEDVERLRWILRQQREHFLPLKVIKGRLSESGAEPSAEDADVAGAPADMGMSPSVDATLASETAGGPSRVVLTGGADPVATADPSAGEAEGPAHRHASSVAATLFGGQADDPAAPRAVGPAGAPASVPAVSPVTSASIPSATRAAATTRGTVAATEGPEPAHLAGTAPAAGAGPVGPAAAPGPAGPAAGTGPAGGVGPLSADTFTGRGGGRRHDRHDRQDGQDRKAAGTAGPAAARSALGVSANEINLTVEELATSCGLPVERVRELERFGLLASRDIGGTGYYDAEAQAVATLAAGFAAHGVEARHLRMYKNAAERESGLFEQIVMPLIKQRNPRSRQQAAETLEELSRLGSDLRDAMLRQSLRDAF